MFSLFSVCISFLKKGSFRIRMKEPRVISTKLNCFIDSQMRPRTQRSCGQKTPTLTCRSLLFWFHIGSYLMFHSHIVLRLQSHSKYTSVLAMKIIECTSSANWWKTNEQGIVCLSFILQDHEHQYLNNLQTHIAKILILRIKSNQTSIYC